MTGRAVTASPLGTVHQAVRRHERWRGYFHTACGRTVLADPEAGPAELSCGTCVRVVAAQPRPVPPPPAPARRGRPVVPVLVLIVVMAVLLAAAL